MNKTLIIIGVAILVVIIGVSVFFLLHPASSTPGTGTQTTGSLPGVTTTTTTPIVLNTPTSTTFQIGTSEGSVVVNNFYNNAAYVTQDKMTVVITQTPDYEIVYNVSDSSFVISLLSLPLPQAKAAAEAAFLEELGISQADACKLTVEEGVPIGVSEQYPGENLGLSFCPGAVQL